MPPPSEGPNGTASAGSGATVPRIPDHVLLRKIAEGSYGEIWLARCALSHYRAAKIVHRSRFQDSRPYEREYSGIQNFEPVSREHEAFVDILQVGRNDDAGFFYYVMELADDAQPKQNVDAPETGSNGKSANGPGGVPISDSGPPSDFGVPSDLGLRLSDFYIPHTLAREIGARGALPIDEVLAISSALAEGLKFLHGKGLIHRDIKPSNIIFVGGKPRLADVGLVAELDATRSLVGTLGYFPAEGPGTPQADVYSLGKVIYEAATGKDRQEFPEPPANLGEGQDGSRLLELNEVILRACARKPEDRYQTADAMLRDLNRIRQGDSLVKARARHRVLRRAGAVAAVVFGMAALAGLGWLIKQAGFSSPERNGPPDAQQNDSRVLFSDSFDSPQLDTNKWRVATAKWPSVGYPKYPGTHQFKVAQTNGALLLEAGAQHDNGYTTSAGAWLDSRADLRKYGDCRVEIEMAGTNRNGHAIVTMSEGTYPVDSDDSQSVRLLIMPGSTVAFPSPPIPLRFTRVKVHLLSIPQVAVVYPDAANQDAYEIVDLRGLKEWHLRIHAVAASFFGVNTSAAHVLVKSVTVTAEPASRLVVGFVEQAPAATPLPGAEVRDKNRRRLARTGANGAFMFSATEWPARITAECDGFLPSGETEISGDPRQRHLARVGLRKRQPAFGDVVAVIPTTNVASAALGFRGTNLWALSAEWKGTNCDSILLPVDIQAGQLLPAVSRFRLEGYALESFAPCGNRILATMVHPGRIYELDVGTGRHSLLLKPTSDGRHIDWPRACAFDGTFFWIAECRQFQTNWGLHALDPATLETKHWLPCDDRGMRSLAWDHDRQQFWVSSSSDGGRVYALNREIALREGKMAPAMMRSFVGRYQSLAYGAGHLWGLDPQRKQICKIKVTD